MDIVLIFFVITGGLIIYCLLDKQRAQKSIVIWCGLNLFLFGALRSTSIGIDIPSYVDVYQSLPNMTFMSILTSYHTVVSRDPVFYLFLKILSLINEDPQFMLISISAILAFCLSIFIYRNSSNPLISFIMFIGLRYYAFTLSGLRQAIAWSMIMLSYESIKSHKILKFFIIVSVASLFHSSAVIFLLAYPLSTIKIKTTSIILVFVLMFNYLTNNIVIMLLIKMPILLKYSGYILASESEATGITTLIIYIFILVFSFISIQHGINKTNDIYIKYNLSLLGVLFLILNFNYANLDRLGYYFIFPIVALLPNTINEFFDKKSQMLVNSLVVILIVVQFILIGGGAGTENYQFFWK